MDSLPTQAAVSIVNLGYLSYQNMYGNEETNDHDDYGHPKKENYSSNSHSSTNGNASPSSHSIQELKELKMLKEMKLLSLLKKSRDGIKCQSDSSTVSTTSISTSASTFPSAPGALECSFSAMSDEEDIDLDLIPSSASPSPSSSIRSNYLSCRAVEDESHDKTFYLDCDDDLSFESDIFCSDDISLGSDIYCSDDISLEPEEQVIGIRPSLYNSSGNYEEHLAFMTGHIGSTNMEKSEVEEALASIEIEFNDLETNDDIEVDHSITSEEDEEAMIPSVINYHIEENVLHAEEENIGRAHDDSHDIAANERISSWKDMSIDQFPRWSRSIMFLILFGLLACIVSYSVPAFFRSDFKMERNIVSVADPVGYTITNPEEENPIFSTAMRMLTADEVLVSFLL